MEIKIDNMVKFYIYIFFEIFLTLLFLIFLCVFAFFVFFQYESSYEQLSKICDKQFGEGNWVSQDTRVRSDWFSIGQEFTCVSNETGEYLNEIIGVEE